MFIKPLPLCCVLLEVAEVHFEFDAGRCWPGRALLRRLCGRPLPLRAVQHRPLHPGLHSGVSVKEALTKEKRLSFGFTLYIFYTLTLNSAGH